MAISNDDADAIVEFIAGGLTDPRVAGALPPFDHPRLWVNREALQPLSLGGGQPRPGATLPPDALTPDPAVIGADCRLAVTGAPAGWSAVARLSTGAPSGGQVVGGSTLPAAVIDGQGAATVRLTVDSSRYLAGVPVYVQWELSPTAGGAVAARSTVSRIVPFCPRAGCVSACPGDLGSAGGAIGPDGVLNNNDFIAFITLFFQLSPAADIGVAGGLPGSDGQHNNNDFIAFIQRFFEGC
ncbi:MAG: GC-type dockerin domain-anchored protein [Phycisphaerales bacterium]